jgi:hypothetical protein
VDDSCHVSVFLGQMQIYNLGKHFIRKQRREVPQAGDLNPYVSQHIQQVIVLGVVSISYSK